MAMSVFTPIRRLFWQFRVLSWGKLVAKDLVDISGPPSSLVEQCQCALTPRTELRAIVVLAYVLAQAVMKSPTDDDIRGALMTAINVELKSAAKQIGVAGADFGRTRDHAFQQLDTAMATARLDQHWELRLGQSCYSLVTGNPSDTQLAAPVGAHAIAWFNGAIKLIQAATPMLPKR